MKKICLFLILFIFSIQVYSNENIGVDKGNPPFMFDNNGKVDGIYPLLIREIFKNIQIPVTITTYPWKRLINLADSGKTGIAGIYKNEKRLKKYDYSDKLYSETIVIYSLKKNYFNFEKISDLKGKKIGVIAGWSYGKEFDEARKNKLFSVKEVLSDEQNFKKLFFSRIDYILSIKESGILLLNKNPDFKKHIISLEKPIIENFTYLIFPKVANKKKIIKKFNSELKKLKKSGKYNELIKNYLSK